MKTLTVVAVSVSVAVSTLLASPVAAQDAKVPAPAALASAPIANPAVTGLRWPWSRAKDIVVRAAEKMPEALYAFQPTPDVRTFGQLVGHVADSNVMLCSMALGEKKEPWTVEKTRTSKADLVAALRESIGVCDRVFAAGDADLAKGVNLFGVDTTRFALAGLIVGHEFEHYGNMVTYMRMKGLVPPSSEAQPAPATATK